MPRTLTHPERHKSHRVGWLRASVLGANDGIVSTASLLMGVAAADVATSTLVTTGVAALTAGALSMAMGEYVSVSSQRDSENADIARERHELEKFPAHEFDELTGIYIDKGLSPELARQVATELGKGDLLAVHMAEELGITSDTIARPVQAALTSSVSFGLGAAIAVIAMVLAPTNARLAVTATVAIIALGALGAIGARIGGAAISRPTIRTLVGGAAAMGITTVIGHLVGGAVG